MPADDADTAIRLLRIGRGQQEIRLMLAELLRRSEPAPKVQPPDDGN